MKIQLTDFPGWNEFPVYHVWKWVEYNEILNWMNKNRVKYFLLSSGANGYTFQVKTNHEWFILKWL